MNFINNIHKSKRADTILLIAINARYTHSNPAVYYLREYVKDLDYRTQIIEFDLTFNIHSIIEHICHENPIAVCFSVFIWNTVIIQTLLSRLKIDLPDVKIILGGPEVSFNPEVWLENYTGIDYIICKGGEAGFRYLLQKKLQHDRKIIRLSNPDFNRIPFPYPDVNTNVFKNKYVYYESSRGCCFKCIYCLSSVDMERVEYKDLKTVQQELDALLNIRCKCIKFIDRSFNLNKKHARWIWEYLIRNYRPGIMFHFEIHPQLLDDTDIDILRNVPPVFFQFEIGIQTIHQDTLKEIQRNGSWSLIRQNIMKIIKIKNIHVHLDLIAGLPGEDLRMIRQSFNEVYDLRPHHLQFGFLKILKGTAIAERINDYAVSYQDMPPYMVQQTKWLSPGNFNRLHRIESAVNALYNPGKLMTVIDELLLHFDTPFQMYEKLVEFADQMNLSVFTKDWNKNAEFILKFVETYLSDKYSFFYDCIKYDFCLLGNFNHYPVFINGHGIIKLKRKILKQFREGKIILSHWTLQDVNQAALVITNNKEFQKKYLSGYNSALIVTKNNYPHLFLLTIDSY